MNALVVAGAISVGQVANAESLKTSEEFAAVEESLVKASEILSKTARTRNTHYVSQQINQINELLMSSIGTLNALQDSLAEASSDSTASPSDSYSNNGTSLVAASPSPSPSAVATVLPLPSEPKNIGW